MVELYTVKPLSPLRKIIAARMAEAKRTIPHFRLRADFEVDTLIGLKKRLMGQRGEPRVSLNDLLIKASAGALMDTPQVNAQWMEEEIHQYKSADISIVMAIEGGLSTPVIRSADSKSIWQISREVRELAARAATNKLKMSEIQGGSFSISNLGMYGVEQFDAIINPPQCAILAIGTARPQVVVSAAKVMRIATLLPVTLSCDHRAIDGATGAMFLSALRHRVEEPEQLSTGEEE